MKGTMVTGITITGHSRLRVLSLVLWVVALHSLLVGIGLVVRPSSLMATFGFGPCYERFFPTQGGIFHIVMAIGYGLAAKDPVQHASLILFAIIVKTIAAIYLLLYYLIIDPLWIVLFSGVIDGVMGVAILMANQAFQEFRYEEEGA